MLFQVAPLSGKSMGIEAMLLKVVFQVSCPDPMFLAGIKDTLNLIRIRARIQLLALLFLPVLHHHGDAGGAAALFLLLDKRYVKPDAGSCGKDNAAETHHQD